MYKKKLAFIAVLLAIFVSSSSMLFAQDADWYYNKPIKSVVFEGLKTIKSADLDGVSSAYIGKPFTDEIFADLMNRFYALDFFEDISPQAVPGDADKSSVTILFTVIEHPIISKINFKGTKQVRKNDLKEKISIKEKDIFNEAKMLIDERTIRNLYLEKGFTSVQISSHYEDTPMGIEVTYEIDEGKATVISKILFQGNAVVAERTLKKKLTLKEAGIINKGAFQEAMLETDRQSVLSYYRDRGYIDANVVDITKDVKYNEEKKRDEITLTFIVQEGSQYTYGGINFTGNKIFTSEQLNALIKLKVGAIFNYTKFQESLTAVTDLYYENGYTANRFLPSIEKDTNTKTIVYNVEITENPRSHVENIVIKGNVITKDNVIRREIPIEEGDIFSKAKLITGLRNLYNLQYFSAIVPDFLPGSEENLIDLVLNVEEQNTRNLEFGFTFNGITTPDELPVSVYFKIQNSNLFGEGKTISAGTTLSADEQSIDLSFGENWIFGLPISTSINLSYAHAKDYLIRSKVLANGAIDDDLYYMQYEQHQFSLGFALGRRWTPDFAILSLSGGITGSLIDNIFNPNLWTPMDSTVSQYNNNWAPQNSLWTAFSVDGRDVNYNPSNGWFVSQKASWFGILPKDSIIKDWGETEFYLRSETKGELYFTLIDKPIKDNWGIKLTVMAYSGLSLQLPLREDTAPGQTSKLYIDGMFNGRGWNIYNKKRGMAMWSNTAEMRIPVIPSILAIDFFFDAVAIKNNANAMFTDTFNKNDWYFSWGPEGRFLIQQFPIKFVLANTFKITDNGIQPRNRTDRYDVEWYENWNFTLSFNIINK